MRNFEFGHNLPDKRLLRKQLRLAATRYLRDCFAQLQPLAKAGRPAGAFFLATDLQGKTQRIAVRTSFDRWVSSVRMADGGWKTIRDADLVLIAAASTAQPDTVDIIQVAACDFIAHLESAFAVRVQNGHKGNGLAHADHKNGASGDAGYSNGAANFPIWICLDKKNGDEAWAAGSGLITQAVATASVSLHEAPHHLESEAGSGGGLPLCFETIGAPIDVQAIKTAVASSLGVPFDAIEITVRVRL